MSALNDALKSKEHRMDPKSGFHFWVRCSSAVAGGNGARLIGQHPQGFAVLHKQEVILVQGADRHVLQNDAVVGVDRDNGIAA